MEIYQEFGNDLVIGINGDLMSVDGPQLSNQRIVRRLLTNLKDYIWNPTYGGSLPQFIGQLNSPQILAQIKGVIATQLSLESTVSQSPSPVITLTGLPNQLNCTITYTYSVTNSQVVVTFSIPHMASSTGFISSTVS